MRIYSTLLMALLLSACAAPVSVPAPAPVLPPTTAPEPAPAVVSAPVAAPTQATASESVYSERTYLNSLVEGVVKNPPSISRDNGGSHYLPGGTGQVIFESDEIIGFLHFTADANPERSNYRFRTYSKRFRQEINGDGHVVEKVYRIMDPLRKERSGSAIAIDKGSVEWVDAGFYKARWSLGSYVYYDEAKVEAAYGSEESFEERMREHARAHANEPTGEVK